MPINILSPQVANQIAAGELVERPASVVKEIIENSLDAGASYINVTIEKGGIKLIRIRDNGCGIAKSELALALARHATSKISSLDDLNSIVSLGFRGEALASISAVSRLTLTSRTVDQNQAWQAYIEGHTMKLTMKPAAHPVGTSLEVLDLFYNKPARRKFMCTEKTEFMHIDTVIRRIALARFDVEISLVHNSKLIRQYHPAIHESQRERRLAAICGKTFMQHLIRIDWKNDNLSLHGCIATWEGKSYKSTDLQYCYVNGRITCNKLINHAIYHAYHIVLGTIQQLAYVLYLEIDPHQVDVNVHPAKREVRFYQSRLVHDFIWQGVMNVLKTNSIVGTNTNNQHVENLSPSKLLINNYQSIAKHDFVQQVTLHNSNNTITYNNKKLDTQKKILGSLAQENDLNRIAVSVPSIRTQLKIETPVFSYTHNFGSLLSIVRRRYALLIIDDILQLLSISVAVRCLKELQLNSVKEKLKLYPLLIPIRLQITEREVRLIDKQAELLSLIGINLQQEGQYVILRELPIPLRTQNLKTLIPELLDYLIQHQEVSLTSLIKWLVYRDSLEQVYWNYEQVVTLLIELEKLYPQLLKSPPSNLIRIIEIDNIINSLNDNAS